MKFNADSAGFFTSLLCAVHCSVLPIMVSFGFIGAGSWLHNHMVDWVVIGIGVFLAGYSLLNDYIQRHRNVLPLLSAVVGFTFLGIGMIEHHGWMLVFSVVGGLLVALGHVLNVMVAKNICVHQ